MLLTCRHGLSLGLNCLLLLTSAAISQTHLPPVLAPATQAATRAVEGFSLVVLPDTQIYARNHPDIFHAQTRWIADHAERLKIKYVLHVGDLTNDNVPPQWAVARAAIARLDGKVPYALALGNHDIGPGGTSRDRSTLFEKYFPLAHWKAMPTFGGVYDKEPQSAANSVHTFEAADRKWLILVLEFAPRDDVLRWAGEVAAARADHRVIVVTHAYLYPDGLRYDRPLRQPHRISGYRIGREGNDGQQIWDTLVRRCENIRLVVCGHVWTTGRRSDANAAGNTVHQMVVNYQRAYRGGEGYLRVISFAKDGESADVYDYSPVLDKINAAAGTSFHIDFEAAPESKPQATSQPATAPGAKENTNGTNEEKK